MATGIARALYRRFWVIPKIQRRYSQMPLQDTFQKIYASGAWGKTEDAFSSGFGSRGEVMEAYCELVSKFIRDRKIRSVIDLGCGDFSVGRRIVENTDVVYTGVDIVPELVEHHRETVGRTDRVSFLHADLTSDELPGAELCLVRQVLQHLSNDEIARALANLKKFPLVLISEDVPKRLKSYNRDKPHGPDVRGYYGSGVFIDRPPFAERVAESWDLELTMDSTLRTFVLDRGKAIPA